jgi:hypothetical protein
MTKRGYRCAFLGLVLLGCGGTGATTDGGGGGSGAGPGGRGGAGGGAGSGSGVAGGGSSGSGVAGGSGSVAGSGGGVAGGGGGAAGTSGSGGGGNGGASGGGGSAAGRGGGGGGGSGGSLGGSGGVAGGGAGNAGNAGRGGASGGGGAAPIMTCTAPASCTGTPFTAGNYCTIPSWSCVDGSCTWECMGGRTCTEAPSSGCLICSSSTPPSSCIGNACEISPTRTWRTTRLNCTSLPPLDFATWSCWGQRGAENVGGQLRLCTIQPIATGALRYSVSCGECVTIVEDT